MIVRARPNVVRICVLLLASVTSVAFGQGTGDLSDRVEGMLIGSLVGDAAGGPHEFQDPDRSVWTREDTVLSDAGIRELADRFSLRDYARPREPYAHWTDDAPAGSVTDDSRFKILFFQSLEKAGRVDRATFARSLLAWHADTTGRYGTLPREWLDEFAYGARWVLGRRESEEALPPERSWGGIPTMAGQMPFLPVAALAPGQPERAYRMFWKVDFLDNGVARDLNAALAAGLAAALAPGATWRTVEKAMRETDPFRFGEVPWVPRKLESWLDVAHAAVRDADGRASRLFDLLEERLEATTWWEAWVPMTVVFACAELVRYDPMATMQLVLEFGHDTDSYLQIAGALVGALHGSSVFPEEIRARVRARLLADYGVDPARWVTLLRQLESR